MRRFSMWKKVHVAGTSATRGPFLQELLCVPAYRPLQTKTGHWCLVLLHARAFYLHFSHSQDVSANGISGPNTNFTLDRLIGCCSCSCLLFAAIGKIIAGASFVYSKKLLCDHYALLNPHRPNSLTNLSLNINLSSLLFLKFLCHRTLRHIRSNKLCVQRLSTQVRCV